MATIVIENYLKALYALSQNNGVVSLTDLSKELEVSLPTVNNMVKKLQEKGWINYQKYKPIKLTKAGRLRAASVIRKHRLTEMFLVKIMGFGWEEVHDIAEQIEHIKSDIYFERMDELLGFPTTDPHGSPIPNKSGVIIKHNYKPLSEIGQNTQVIIAALKDSSFELLNYLNKKNIKLGDIIRVNYIEPFDNSFSILLPDSREIIMTNPVCQSLLVIEQPDK
tara:strand:- start:33 stop:698 length:666 start_codon:yes stop_codon:yes gene_type:complete